MPSVVLVVCGALPFGFVALLVWAAVVDVRTGRGYGLCILSSLLLGLTILVGGSVLIAVQQQKQPPSMHNGSPAVLLLFYFIPAMYAMAATMVAAATVAGIARHWLWIVGFGAAVLVPVLLVVPPYPFLDLSTAYHLQQAGIAGLFFVPEATVLAYSITRLRHPVVPAPVRQPATP